MDAKNSICECKGLTVELCFSGLHLQFFGAKYRIINVDMSISVPSAAYSRELHIHKTRLISYHHDSTVNTLVAEDRRDE